MPVPRYSVLSRARLHIDLSARRTALHLMPTPITQLILRVPNALTFNNRHDAGRTLIHHNANAVWVCCNESMT